MSRIISAKTYHDFAKKYKIKLTKTKDGIKIIKPLKLLASEIYIFEQSKNINDGLYFKSDIVIRDDNNKIIFTGNLNEFKIWFKKNNK